MAHYAHLIGGRGMEVNQQMTERPGRRLAKHVHGMSPGREKRLQQQVAHPQLISRVLECHHIMRIVRDALGIATRWKHVLIQVDNGEQVQYTFVAAPPIHEIVHDQDASLRKPLGQFPCFRNSFVNHDPSVLHGLESLLPHPLEIMNLGRRGSNKSKLFNTRFSVKVVFPHPEGPKTRMLVGARNLNGGRHIFQTKSEPWLEHSSLFINTVHDNNSYKVYSK